MSVNHGERAIFAYFPSSAKARAAAKALAAAGFPDIHIKRVSRYGVVRDRNRDNVLTGAAETLTGLTLYSASTDKDKNASARVLMAADPSVSGFSMQGYGLAGGKSFVLVAFATEPHVERVVEILKAHGGDV